MKHKCIVALLLLVPAICFAGSCKTSESINLESYTADIGASQITFLVWNASNNHCHFINKPGLTQRHAPYSSFKIPHSLIALETGAVKSMDERIEWDAVKYPAKSFWPETWKQSHTLASAFKHSAVWYYKAMVPRIKPAEYKKWLSAFHYGNQTFTPGSDEFWLNNELQISPHEQVEFIACLLKSRCGITAHHLAAFESAALQETKHGLSLYAKTGAGPIDPNNFDGAFEGWYVGYIKSDGGKPIAAFALYMEAKNFSALKDARKALSLRLLKDVGLWDNKQ
ncbi:hypothetical protein CBP51_20320 [Cellvibrio mixtus]|uniref:Beta-lactamase n=1 Tax=Cellvibrio mixtus TaxID=39650 RepID=A0A266Q1I7_9GAMM|nr:penicillin-binding transpeptidase domain-containing protein [Cellvibrio mixtus]OZY83737.1 hypothetical protein CBP51_20320 [Cellvibrio mixtus]